MDCMAGPGRSRKKSGVFRDGQVIGAPVAPALQGGAGSRPIALAVTFAFAAGIAAIALMLFVAPSGGEIGSQAPVGAEADEGPIDVGDVPVPLAPSDGNATTGLPLPGDPLP